MRSLAEVSRSHCPVTDVLRRLHTFSGAKDEAIEGTLLALVSVQIILSGCVHALGT